MFLKGMCVFHFFFIKMIKLSPSFLHLLSLRIQNILVI